MYNLEKQNNKDKTIKVLQQCMFYILQVGDHNFSVIVCVVLAVPVIFHCQQQWRKGFDNVFRYPKLKVNKIL